MDLSLDIVILTRRNMLVLVMIPTAYEILTKLSMCLPASMKLAKFKHYQLDIRISPLPHY